MPLLRFDHGAVEAPQSRLRRAGVSPRRPQAHARHKPRLIFIEPGSWLWNPFQRRGISKPRAFILYGHWLANQLTPAILLAARFGRDEIDALDRWRGILLGILPRLTGAIFRCICRRSDPWCHHGIVERATAGAMP